jgi:biotin carboxylase
MKKEKLMIVGAAKFQVPIIELAKQKGFETIVVSIAGNYPGFSVADKSYEVDVRDKKTILEIARNEGISGIVTDQTDLPVPTVAYVAEKMGLPGIGYECALRITNKLKGREHCKTLGFPIPAFVEAHNWEEAKNGAKEIGFPMVVKPTDSMAARGISKVSDWSELPNKFQDALSCSTSGVVLLERFFQGKKIGLVGFASDNQCTDLIMVDHEHFDIPDKFIVRQVLTPSVLDKKLKDKIWDFHNKLFESFGPRFGFTYSEIRVNEESGEFCLMEPAIRGPAGFVSSHLVPLSCGVDFLPLLLDLASGRRDTVMIPKYQLQSRGAGNIYFYLPEGTISRVSGVEEVKSLPGIYRTELDDLIVGRKIAPLVNLNGRQGPIIYAGKDRKECEEIVKKIKDLLFVEVKTTDGVKVIIWS